MIKFVFVLSLALSAIKADPLGDFVTFTNAVWGNFQLANPVHVQSCFNETTAADFFSLINSAYHISNDTMFGNLTAYMLFDSQDEQSEQQDISGQVNCLVATSDFTSLVSKLQFQGPIANSSVLFLLFNTWMNAYPNQVSSSLGQVVQSLQAGNIQQAGTQAGQFLSLINYNDLQNDLVAYQIISFFNGVFLGLNLPFPSEAGQCFAKYPTTTLGVLNQFYTNLWKTVGSGVVLETYVTAHGYYTGAGLKTYNQIPPSLFQCLNATTDSQRLIQAVAFGFDPLEPCYTNAAYAFIKSTWDNMYEFHAISNNIYTKLIPDFFDAGALTYKILLQGVSSYAQC